ncbi:GPW/gp25 family protein [Variovorax sp. J22R24]|jgi:phage baseplate assembly protein W|uniref:GPW/gp25 family protein n=1 Tax=Variovorax gracilis TaxID=3053502 RepID=UPI002578F52E|nr:GPW/gp25 family protein [Variovorax sp. J22R24]MDM0109293.1 GPW/gp25 family protein [Variovorax sp. J22R24]
MDTDIGFPLRVDGRGRSALVSREAHLRDLIEQLLFTVPGERVNRPDFGCGLMQLVFAPNSPELAATVQALVHGALQQWLGHLVRIDEVSAESVDATLSVAVRYTVLETMQTGQAQFRREAP